jgi:hypothetical protein
MYGEKRLLRSTPNSIARSQSLKEPPREAAAMSKNEEAGKLLVEKAVN